ncbi:MerR family transcriptional regulator [Nocardia sp. NPDC003693]
MVGGAEYTIDELAQAAGTTVRSVRVYHERGVLPPPQVRGRTGYYGAEHLNRVRTIGRLLERGIKLNGIKELLAAWDRGDDLGAVLGVATRTRDELGAVDAAIPATELQARYADVPDGLARVVALGIYQPVDAVTYRIADPELLAVVDRLATAGVPNTDILRELDWLHVTCDRIARRFVDLTQQYAWEPYAESDRTPADAALLADRVTTLRTMCGPVIGELTGRLVDRRIQEDGDLSEVLGEG